MNTKLITLFVFLLATFCFAQSGEVQETGKVLVVHYKFTDSGLVETRSSVVYGLPSDLQDAGAYTARVLDTSGASLQESQFSDPRVYFGDEMGEQGLTGLGGVNPDAELVLILPFNTSMQKIVISNTSSGQKLFEADLSSTVVNFCSAHPQDVDCVKSQPKATAMDLSGLLLPAIALVLAVAIIVFFVFGKKNAEAGEKKKK
ncbi:MAG: hypothetical protein V1492_04945 [Candidatus Micrarchaeota archaeon]